MAVRVYDRRDLDNLKQVLDSGRLGSNKDGFAPEFGRKFAKELGAEFALPMNSAMSAMHCAVAAAGVGPGVEVICDPIVHFGAISVMYHNGVPVFADVDKNTHNISPDSIREHLTERTRAIICTHLWGLPCEMDEIMAIAAQHDLVVIEDCAHSLFARYKGAYTGTIGHIGTFSFQQSKHLSTGDGGMAVTNDEELSKAMTVVRDFGRTPERLSWNYRMNELTAAVGVAQLERARGYVEQTIENAGIFADALGEFAWLVPQHIAPDSTSAYHFFVPTFYGDERGIDYEAFQAACREENCVVNFGYNQVPAYQYALFREPLAYGRGCPTACPLYEGTYLVGDGLCPVAEDILPRMMLLNTLGPQDEISRRAAALKRAADKTAQAAR